jgi:hypothetical protein
MLKRIETFGRVNPYLDGYAVCDGANTTIRYKEQTVIMVYNCGAPSAPFADEATFRSEELLIALRSETKADPDTTQIMNP